MNTEKDSRNCVQAVPTIGFRVFLKAFPHSLEVVAKGWLYYLAPRSITGWDDLKRMFLEKFFPASRTTTIRKDISGIR